MRKKEALLKNSIWFLVPVICAGLIFIAIFKLLLPQVEVIRNSRQILSQKESNLTALKRKSQELEVLDDEVLVGRLEKVNLALPSEKTIIPVIGNLRILSGQNSLALGKIELIPGLISTESAKEPKIPKSSPEFSSLSFKVILEGDLSSLKTFLGQIERTAPALRVKNLTLTRREGKFSADTEMVFFWQPLPKTLGKITDPLPQFTDTEQEVLARISQFSSLPMTFFPPEATSSSQERLNLFE